MEGITHRLISCSSNISTTTCLYNNVVQVLELGYNLLFSRVEPVGSLAVSYTSPTQTVSINAHTFFNYSLHTKPNLLLQLPVQYILIDFIFVFGWSGLEHITFVFLFNFINSAQVSSTHWLMHLSCSGRYFSSNCLGMKMALALAVPRPAIKPNCISSIDTC